VLWQRHGIQIASTKVGGGFAAGAAHFESLREQTISLAAFRGKALVPVDRVFDGRTLIRLYAGS
jgi:hypothetical protein